LGGGVAMLGGWLAPFALGTLILWSVRQQWLDQRLLPALLQEHAGGLWLQAGKLWLLCACAGGLTLLGLIDDIHPLPWPIRLALQGCLATLATWGVPETRLTLFIPWPECTFALTVLWYVGMMNAFNMLDNMDGLSAGVAALATASMMGLLLFLPDPHTQQLQLFVLVLMGVLLGSVLGFLVHNFPPAQIFMGDAGSYATGFLLAAGTLLTTYASGGQGREHAVLAPLSLLAIPLYDMVSVVAVRLLQGRSPFAADQQHLSHRLTRLGLSRRQAVQAIYLLVALTGAVSCALPHVPRNAAVGLVGLVACLLGLLGSLEWLWHRPESQPPRKPS
jgi:UDP-GlcNAc:undecaprenyl-phosphate GlcNAc-1-phosphate transferase